MDVQERQQTYEEYLESDEWKERAHRAKQQAGYRCIICYSTYRVEAHHRTYIRRGHELDSDLIVLCRKCHALFHRRLRVEKE